MNHIFDIDIASKYGLDEAILLQNINYWCVKNKANNSNLKKGYHWTYNSVAAFNELFPYLTPHRITKALKHLEQEGLILVGNYNENPYDRTKWYAISEEGECILQNSKIDYQNNANGEVKNGKCTLPKRGKCSTTTDINTNSKPNSKQKKTKLEKSLELISTLDKERQLIFKEWLEYKKSKNQNYTEVGLKKLIDKVTEFSNTELKNALDISISNNYSGIFPKHENKPKSNFYRADSNTPKEKINQFRVLEFSAED